MKLATTFVPTSQPASLTMSGIAVTTATLTRCGGTSFDKANPALLIGVENQDITSMTLDHVQIIASSYDAIDWRVVSDGPAPAMPGSITGVAITNTEVIAAATCGTVDADVRGRATLTTTCACASTTSAASTCTIDNLDGSGFTIASDSCNAAGCD